MAKRKCRHSLPEITFRPDISLDGPFSMRCPCGAQLSLGPSNDEPAEVKVEMRAAELDAWWSRDALGHEEFNVSEADGWMEHAGAEGDPSGNGGVVAGWLARELATHDDRATRDADAWSWDPKRPVAGQYEISRHIAESPFGEDTTPDPYDDSDHQPYCDSLRGALECNCSLRDATESEATDQMSMSAIDELEAGEQ